MRINFKHKLRYITLSVTVAVVGAFWISASNPDFALGRNIQILFNMFRDVNMFYVDSVDTDKLLVDAAKGMVSGLDPYTELIPESGMENFEFQTTGKYGGMGSLVRKSGDYVILAQPYKGFPADKAGLVIGDKIMAINGESVKGYDVTKVSSMLKGEPNTKMKLTVEKMLTGEIVDVEIRRERISISGVSYYGIVGDSVGYIVHDDFTEGCSDDIRKAFLELKAKGITSLVLDLRSNGGGILQEAVKVLSLFVPKGTEVVSMKGRATKSEVVYKTETEPIDTQMPIAVMINGYSASAAEIVAGALQDLDRAVLVGQRSYGKGLVQATRPLGYNSYLKITTAKYYIPSGRCIQAIDYTHRNDDGSVAHVPDSLIKEYKTAAGRKVFDGCGVMPDSVMSPTYTSRFAMVLYAKGYIEDFANEYYKRHRNGVDVDKFRLNDTDYADFVKFMADKDVEFESQTGNVIAELRQKAEREKYLSSIDDELKAIEAKIKYDKQRDMEQYRQDITKLLEDEIVLRYHYAAGVTRHNTLQDNELAVAVDILKDKPFYNKIVTTQDTKRK